MAPPSFLNLDVGDMNVRGQSTPSWIPSVCVGTQKQANHQMRSSMLRLLPDVWEKSSTRIATCLLRCEEALILGVHTLVQELQTARNYSMTRCHTHHLVQHRLSHQRPLPLLPLNPMEQPAATQDADMQITPRMTRVHLNHKKYKKYKRSSANSWMVTKECSVMYE